MSDGEEFRKLIEDIIQKEIVILGPDITLLKARNVSSLKIDDTGHVTSFSGDPREALRSVIDQFVSLSGQIVKKTMEPLLEKYPSLTAVDLTSLKL